MPVLLRFSLIVMIAFGLRSSLMPDAFCKLFGNCPDNSSKNFVRGIAAEFNPDAPVEVCLSPVEGEDADPELPSGDATLSPAFNYPSVEESRNRRQLKASCLAIWLMNQNIRI